MLLEDARTTTNQQLAQLHKLDDEAVRTVRIALVLAGLLVGGAQFLPFSDLGLLGAFGTLSLVGSLVTSLFVYGTSGLFVGPTPDELSSEPEERSNTDAAPAELLQRYERGLVQNRHVLVGNGFVFAVSRLLLAGAILLFALAFAFDIGVQPVTVLYEPFSIVEFNP